LSVKPNLVANLPTWAVVPAAGLGTRLRPLSSALPKEMLPVGGKVALERILDELAAAGITDAIIVLSHAKEPLIKGYFGTQFATTHGPMTVHYAIQTAMRGLGDAILCAEGLLPAGESFVVALGDTVFEEPVVGGLLNRVIQSAQEAAMGVAVQEVPEEKISRYGIIAPLDVPNTTSDQHQPFAMRTIVEKPAPADAPSRFAVAARYVLPFETLAILRETPPASNGEIQLTDALVTLLERHNGQAFGQAVPLQSGEVRHDLGNKESYYKSFLTFSLQDADTKEAFQAFGQEIFCQHSKEQKEQTV
jgi:UTP--glucose-1-phosphate uridylyltransferase